MRLIGSLPFPRYLAAEPELLQIKDVANERRHRKIAISREPDGISLVEIRSIVPTDRVMVARNSSLNGTSEIRPQHM
jgi:hypothetical protein